MDTKRCHRCGMTRDRSEFTVDRSRTDGKDPVCRPCKKEYQLWYDYRLTPAEFDGILTSQGGGCAICGALECASGNRFTVDHDHSCCPGKRSCGKCVRGIVCRGCNSAIGFLRDNPALLRRAAEYLEGGGVSTSQTP